MINSLYGVYGASGFGREVMPLVRQSLIKQDESSYQLVFIDDSGKDLSVNRHDVLTFEDFLKTEASQRYVVIAIADSGVRELLTKKCQEKDVKFINVIAENVVMMDEVQLGENSILSPFVTITSNVKIGIGFQANIYSYVAHDCVVGDYVTFAPGVQCNGNVHIEDHVYIGTGAIIKQGKPSRPIVIGKNSIIAAGAVVTKNVPSGITVFGNPAQELTKDNLRKK